jgi:hypothetical protein
MTPQKHFTPLGGFSVKPVGLGIACSRFIFKTRLQFSHSALTKSVFSLKYFIEIS